MAVWKYGNKPFFIKALTNNNGDSKIFKMVLSRALIEEKEELPLPPMDFYETPPTSEISINIQEIWYLFNSKVPIDADDHPKLKRSLISKRKKSTKVKKEEFKKKGVSEEVEQLVNDIDFERLYPANDRLVVRHQNQFTNNSSSGSSNTNSLCLVNSIFDKQQQSLERIIIDNSNNIKQITQNSNDTITRVTENFTTSLEKINESMEKREEATREFMFKLMMEFKNNKKN